MKKKLVVLTGAGMSAESGISTFRDSDGLWEKYRVEDVATPEGFAADPELVLNFYNQRRRELLNTKPNAGHIGLADLEQEFDVHIITQNIDNLHERAGSSHVIHLHGELIGVSNTDDITFDSLVGIEYQKQVLIDNTKAFVSGKAANNVLLFGDRGTGKSSSVKALLNMFCDDGLRIIEMPKHCIKDIPSLSKVLAESPNKYIIFLDDLTFESHETEYRALKVAMEGQLQANPTNVLIYATSNRRHLIRENWSDREGGEIHVNDQMQETLSLSERFGISLVFSAPNQKEYLNIVSEMLKKHNIQMNADIEKEAVVWQMNYGGRSARCAKQFVTSYIAK